MFNDGFHKPKNRSLSTHRMTVLFLPFLFAQAESFKNMSLVITTSCCISSLLMLVLDFVEVGFYMCLSRESFSRWQHWPNLESGAKLKETCLLYV